MNDIIISVVIMIIGILIGAGLVLQGFRTGFRFSCAIRQANNGEEPTLNKQSSDAAEFELLEKET
jgi:hypothetical protein